MCGIVVQIGSIPKKSQQRAALAVLKNRGPDGTGEFHDTGAQIWMGHTRLAINDLDNGSQPLFSRDKQIVAIINGELYGDKKIREGLKAKGHVFSGHCDSNILIPLYETYGFEACHRLRGAFSFVLWDRRKNLFWAVRDRFGIKPLCYHYDATTKVLRIASNGKALFALGVKPSWSERTLSHIYRHQYPLPMDSLFRGVQMVEPGHMLLKQVNSPPVFKRYWDIKAAKMPTSDPELLYEKLSDSVKLRLRSDVPMAVALSGGIDSASILSIANRYSNSALPCYGIDFGHPDYSEAQYASRIARHCGSSFEAVPINAEQMTDALGTAVWEAEQLCINGQLPAKYVLHQHIAGTGVRVVLSGEGADEALWGYPHLKQDWLKGLSADQQKNVLQQINLEHTISSGIMLDLSDSEKHCLGFLAAKRKLCGPIQSLLTNEFVEKQRLNAIDSALDEFITQRTEGFSRVERSTYAWTKLALASYILKAIGDGMEMAHGIEGRPPFLDHHFFDYATSLSVKDKINTGIEKFALRQAMRPFLPDFVCNRPKHPFIAPPLRLLSDHKNKKWLRTTLLDGNIHGINRKKLEQWLKTLMKEPTPHEEKRTEPALLLLCSVALISEKLGLGR